MLRSIFTLMIVWIVCGFINWQKEESLNNRQSLYHPKLSWPLKERLGDRSQTWWHLTSVMPFSHPQLSQYITIPQSETLYFNPSSRTDIGFSSWPLLKMAAKPAAKFPYRGVYICQPYRICLLRSWGDRVIRRYNHKNVPVIYFTLK